MNIKHLFPFLCCLALLNSCVDEIELGIPTPADFIVVDGILNYSRDADSSDLVVRLAISRNNLIRPIGINKAKVELIVNDKDAYLLEEKEVGYYYLLNKGMFKVGDKYRLRFQTGIDKYESDNEILQDSVPLDRVYSEVIKGRTSNNAFEIFVDMKDDPTKKNYYRWSMIQWEKQEFCSFCYRIGKSPEYCTEDLYGTPNVMITRNPTCSGDCYDISRFYTNNAISDIFINGKTLIKKSIGFVPFNFYQPCLIEVKQSSLTSQYNAFLEILKTQAENTGGLTDTPAALLVGNVKNINNPSEKVVGYFSVTNNSVRRFWLDRENATIIGYRTLSSVNPPLSPPVPSPPSWYPIPCKASRFRTPVKPWGWQ
jgi:Domain of unknown function (DUF4249)